LLLYPQAYILSREKLILPVNFYKYSFFYTKTPFKTGIFSEVVEFPATSCYNFFRQQFCHNSQTKYNSRKD